MTKLQVLVATYGSEGLDRLASSPLPEIKGVEWLINCQCPGKESLPVPPDLNREDIKVSFSDSKGLSRNRNILLDRADAPYCLIADDDLEFFPDGLKKIIDFFDNNPSVDLLLTRYVTDKGEFEKVYPDSPTPLRPVPKGYYTTSFEIAFRRELVTASSIRFNENFGVGAPLYGSGEEELWIDDLTRKGLKGMIAPILVTRHKGATTGLREASSPRVLRAQGAVISRLYPLTSLFRVILKSWRVSRTSGGSPLFTLRHILKGWYEGITGSAFSRDVTQTYRNAKYGKTV